MFKEIFEMAGELKLRSGTKLQIAYDVPFGQEPKFNLVSTFFKSIDNTFFLISIPMVSGKPMELDDGEKLLIRYMQGGVENIVSGYPDDIIKEGIRRYWKIRRVTEQRVFAQRADKRLTVTLPIKYIQQTWPVNADGFIDPEDGMTLDISNGGAALFVNRRFEVGEMCDITLPRVGTRPEGAAINDLTGVVCWLREAPKGNIYRYVTGVKFRFGEGEQDRLAAYTSNIQKKYKIVG